MLLGLVLAVGTAGMTMGADLAGSEWRPSFMRASDLPAGSHMVVQFNPDGRITGSGGCNRFFGAYTISGDHIKIGPLAATRKGCPGLLLAETAFFATLEAAKSFEQNDTTLVLFDAFGTKLAQFVRAEEL
ncbi:MAG: META domain-containing protein [Methyloceanibacter sp.]|nr:META domain-containing protein [Methyloceanibacter sp.]